MLPEASEGAQAKASDAAPSTTGALRDIIRDLNDPCNSGRLLWTPDMLKSMSSWQQQDAQEYFSKIVEELDKEVRRMALRRRKRSSSGLASPKRLSDRPTDDEMELDDIRSGEVPKRLNALGKSRDGCAAEKEQAELNISAFHSPLEGLLCQRLECLQCGWSEGLSMIPFICLTLPLGRAWSYSLQTCLDEYTESELIEGVECARCTLLAHRAQLKRALAKPLPGAGEAAVSDAEMYLRDNITSRLNAVQSAIDEEEFTEDTLANTCKISSRNRVTATKSRQILIARPPKSLVLHINRSVFDEITGHQFKNNAGVGFPKRLDLGRWCVDFDGASNTGDARAHGGHPVESAATDQNGEAASSGPIYEIRAVVTHYGRHENGHYYCYRSSPYPAPHNSGQGDPIPIGTVAPAASQRWWRLSDEDVVLVSEDEVSAQGGVFMLFYERVDETRSDTIIETESSTAVEERAPPSTVLVAEQRDPVSVRDSPVDGSSPENDISNVANSQGPVPPFKELPGSFPQASEDNSPAQRCQLPDGALPPSSPSTTIHNSIPAPSSSLSSRSPSFSASSSSALSSFSSSPSFSLSQHHPSATCTSRKRAITRRASADIIDMSPHATSASSSPAALPPLPYSSKRATKSSSSLVLAV